MTTAVRPSGVSGIFFAVCRDHDFRVDGTSDVVWAAVDAHDELMHCASLGCGDALTFEDQASSLPELCTTCRHEALADEAAESAGDLLREA